MTAHIGRRLARIRKDRGITQKELAAMLGTTQSVVSEYEHGELRMHGEIIAQLSQLLRVSADELLGLQQAAPAPDPLQRRLYRRLQAIEQLPRRDQEALLRTIKAFLGQAKVG